MATAQRAASVEESYPEAAFRPTQHTDSSYGETIAVLDEWLTEGRRLIPLGIRRRALSPDKSIAGPEKRPNASMMPSGKWRENELAGQLLDGESAAAYASKDGGLLGLRPGSHGVAVLDVDHGDPRRLLAKYPPLAVAPTRAGTHLIYSAPDGETPNAKWSAEGCSGEVRGSSGYTAIYHPGAWSKAFSLQHADEVRPFPSKLLRAPDPGQRTLGERGTKGSISADQARKTLARIDPDIGHDDWIRVGQGLHDAFHAGALGLRLWDEWSGRGEKYEADECEKRWATFNLGGGITWGSVVKLARDAQPSANGAAAPEVKAAERLLLTRDPDGLAAAFEHLGIALRLNLRGSVDEYRLLDNGRGWQAIQKHELAFWRAKAIPDSCDFPKKKDGEWSTTPAVWGRDSFRDHLLAVLHERRVDPFREYLDTLPEWDTNARIDYWIEDCFFVAEPTELTRWASRFLFMGAITRTMQPGAKLDETPVLIGPKRCGKSTAIRRWLPDNEYFGDAVTFRMSTKEQAEGMEGKVIVELAEMVGSTRAEIDSLKAFLTRQWEQVRKAYGYQVGRQPRMCIFFGSANPGTPIPDDDAASRRFVVIEVAEAEEGGVQALRDYQDKYRDQCWAEALHRYHAGEQARLPEELFGQQDKRNDPFRNRDVPFEDALEQALTTIDHGYRGPFTTADLIRDMNRISPEVADKRRDSKRLGRILRDEKHQYSLSSRKVWDLLNNKRTSAWTRSSDAALDAERCGGPNADLFAP